MGACHYVGRPPSKVACVLPAENTTFRVGGPTACPLPAAGRLTSNTTSTCCLEAARSPFRGQESTRLRTAGCRTGAGSGSHRSRRKSTASMATVSRKAGKDDLTEKCSGIRRKLGNV